MMDNEIVTVEPTEKDFVFYSKFFMKKLKDEHAELTRWLRFTEKRMEDLASQSEVYIKQEELLISYQQRIQDNEDRMQTPMDQENEAFVEYVITQLTIKERQVMNSKRKKENCMTKKKQQQDCIRKFYASESKHNRQQRQSQRDMNYFHEKMIKIDQEMPPYMKENLRRMPSNRGYIYRGVWYFGHVPVSSWEEEQHLTMTERVKGIQYIHEYRMDYPYRTYRLLEKLSKTSAPTEVYSEVRKIRS